MFAYRFSTYEYSDSYRPGITGPFPIESMAPTVTVAPLKLSSPERFGAAELALIENLRRRLQLSNDYVTS